MDTVISVASLNRYVKVLLETDENLFPVTVEGELSNCSINHYSGHVYFSLKDEEASISCVLFRNDAARLHFLPENGKKVQVRGRISLYEKSGSYQLIASDMLLSGKGQIEQELRERKMRLEKEGFFCIDRKRPLPPYPERIGVITSRDGAAIHDILSVLSRRCPFVEVILFHTSVQGVYAEQEIVDAIRSAAADKSLDLIVISRGGGSQEDLWVFNSEQIVREAAKLPVPFISAVGHETDFTLLDYSADLRAPTPSAAAEIAVRDVSELKAEILERSLLIRLLASQRLANINTQLAQTEQLVHDICINRLERSKAQIAELSGKIPRLMSEKIDCYTYQLESKAGKLEALNPMSVLARGYCIAQNLDGQMILSSNSVCRGDSLSLTFSDGQVKCEVL